MISAAAAYLARNGTDVKRLLGSAEAYSVSNSSVYERQNLARDAWHEYLQHPVLGSSIVERRSLAYPHNCVVEAFMATGTFGGAIFVLMLLMAIYRAILLTRVDVAMSWISLCFFQQLIGAMFSGGLYGNAALWGMMAIVLGRRSSSYAAGAVAGQTIVVIVGLNRFLQKGLESLTTTDAFVIPGLAIARSTRSRRHPHISGQFRAPAASNRRAGKCSRAFCWTDDIAAIERCRQVFPEKASLLPESAR